MLYEAAAKRSVGTRPPDIDYRFVLLGSMLPDLIDKPIGGFLFVGTFHNSRIYAHTLLFSVLLLEIGLLLYRKRAKNAGLLLWAGSFAHLLLDRMWRDPETAFWPFWNIGAAAAAAGGKLGVLFGFPYVFDNWMEKVAGDNLSNPVTWTAETAGFLIVLYLLLGPIRKKGLRRFLRSGKL